MTTSFVIPHQGRMPLLIETLMSIAALDNLETVKEIVIVSRDINIAGNSVAEKYQLPAATPSISILKPEPHATIAAMRNQGASHADSDYIAFIDADIKLTPDWLTTMYSLASDNTDTVLFSAVQQPDHNNSMLHRVRSILSQKNKGTDLKSLPGANLFMSLDRFANSQRFNEALVSCEDIIFSTSLLEYGNLHLTDKAAFVHLGEDTDLKELFRKEIFRGESNLFTLRLDKKILAELPSLLAPLLVTAGLTALPVLLWFGGSTISVITALLFFLTPVVTYTLRFKSIRNSISVSYFETFVFYLVYFLGRGTGMLTGPFRRLLRAGKAGN